MSVESLKSLPVLSADAGRQALPASSGRLSPPQKAALIIAVLGPEAAGPVIERISDNHLRAFVRAYAHLQSIPRDQLLTVVEEFLDNLDHSGSELKGGFVEARDLLSQFKEADEIIRLMDDIDAPGGRTVWEKLEAVGDKSLADYLSKQHPQMAAVVLYKIGAEKASQIIARFDAGVAQKVLLRLSKPMPIKPETLSILSDTIQREFLAPMRRTSNAPKPGEMIGGMMNNLPADKRDSLLAFLDGEAPHIIMDVKKAMLTFEDIPERVPANAIARVIREVENETFLKAMKFGRQNAPAVVEYIFKNISQRMAQQYEEEIEKLTQVRVSDAEAAQAEIMSAVRQLARAGEIKLNELASEADDETENYL